VDKLCQKEWVVLLIILLYILFKPKWSRKMSVVITTDGPSGGFRVFVSRSLVGVRWRTILTSAGIRVDVCSEERTLHPEELIDAFGNSCNGAIGQLSESWNADVIRAFKRAGGSALSNYAVGYNNIDVSEASKLGIAVGNTPGVLTEATAELAAALTYAAARHIVPSDKYTREGKFVGWTPTLFLGELLHRKTLGVVGPGRIGQAYIRSMAFGNRMDVVYMSRSDKPLLQKEVAAFNEYLRTIGERPIECTRASTLEELLQRAHVVALLPSYSTELHHLIDAKRLEIMRPDAILVNASRGPIIDEAALVQHLRRFPEFRAALDVYEREPALEEGLRECGNTVLAPHLGSATHWSREAMSVIAALNVLGALKRFPVWTESDLTPFLSEVPPRAIPSLVNREVWK
jgi:hydroxypyruvate reductase 1